MKTITFLISIYLYSLNFAYASDTNIGCDGQFASIINPIAVPTDMIQVDFDSPVDYDVEIIQQWILDIKKRMIANMLDKEGPFAKHLAQYGSMDTNARKDLVFAVEVRPLSKDSNIYIAIFWDPDNLNKSQMRTELYEFGGGDAVPGDIHVENKVFFHESCEACRGLNLKGTSFMKLRQEMEKNNEPMYPVEKVFFENVIAQLEKRHPDGNYNIISLNAKAAAIDTLVHEGHHALYDTDPVYKQALINYWDKNIRGKEDELINKTFPSPYSSYELLQDEFFAYLLQPDVFGQRNPMRVYKEKHLEGVLKALEEVGLKPAFY